ncbi:methionyl-tRNA formyltransferase [Buchnera aphidicola]|uniref:methionyl-tRNA formyltransferase n=1 Tax=Buchnera aphidicola TaxID=9 RepID=UPI002238AD7B|nr:methionyl-tRNA formyltransferase [Buchnera aphidicola]MCW5197507.1 methionyl-tRNA formyltransferase [Buchnera aphidicola (Chaitophorus viminalis)]
MKNIKIIFAGTDKFSSIHLNELIVKKFNILAVITKIDKKIGRGKKIQFSEIKKIAIKNKLSLIQLNSLNSEKYYKILKKLKPDIMIVVSFGLMIPNKIIKIFSLGCINIHTSLLPKFRGPSPIQSVILKGKKKTGISIIQINDKLDAGNIVYKKSINIKKKDTYKTLKKKLCILGKKSLIKFLKNIFLKKNISIPQKENDATYTKKIYKKDGLINWNEKASKIEKKVRAFNTWPGTFFFINKIMIKIWKVNIVQSHKKTTPGKIIKADSNGILISTKKNFINIIKLQISGKKKNTVDKIIHSYKKLFQIGNII